MSESRHEPQPHVEYVNTQSMPLVAVVTDDYYPRRWRNLFLGIAAVVAFVVIVILV